MSGVESLRGTFKYFPADCLQLNFSLVTMITSINILSTLLCFFFKIDQLKKNTPKESPCHRFLEYFCLVGQTSIETAQGQSFQHIARFSLKCYHSRAPIEATAPVKLPIYHCPSVWKKKLLSSKKKRKKRESIFSRL